MIKYNLKTLISTIIAISLIFPTSVSAKITPKEIKDKKVEVITIKKGDTLWDIAKVCYKNPFMWKKFQEFNIITNPDLIFPGEKLVISAEDAKKLKEILEKRVIEVKEEIKEIKEKKEILKKKKEEKPEKVEVIKEVIKEKEVKVPVPDEALLKKIAMLEQEIKLLKKAGKKDEKPPQKEIRVLKEQITSLQEEEAILQASIVELEEKLAIEKTDKQELEGFSQFLAVGIMCAVILLNTFK
ncbi:MAG: LysM peptidoglycan-binding domain-containing protein [bacterium]